MRPENVAREHVPSRPLGEPPWDLAPEQGCWVRGPCVLKHLTNTSRPRTRVGAPSPGGDPAGAALDGRRGARRPPLRLLLCEHSLA